MAKQTFTTGQVLTAAQVNSLQANDFNQTVSVKTANYTLAAADKGTRIEFNTSGSVTCTVNSGLFDAGDTLVIQNRGAGTATITAGTATVNTSASLALAQYSAGTLYFVSDSAALFFGDAAGISASIVDAKGDLIVGTADNTVGRLAVGTNGYTLVADSVETTGLKWVAPASSTVSYDFISSTTLSGTTTTVTGLSGYNSLFIFVQYPSTTGANPYYYLRFNTDSTSKYTNNGVRINSGANPTATVNDLNGDTAVFIGQSGNSAADQFYGFVRVDGANSTSPKIGLVNGAGTATGWYASQTQFIYTGSSVISSVSLISMDGTSFDSGFLRIYGAA